jgi:hypothetical protein
MPQVAPVSKEGREGEAQSPGKAAEGQRGLPSPAFPALTTLHSGESSTFPRPGFAPAPTQAKATQVPLDAFPGRNHQEVLQGLLSQPVLSQSPHQAKQTDMGLKFG